MADANHWSSLDAHLPQDLRAHLESARTDAWRSPWLRACALRAARELELATSFDLQPARAVGDPMVDEELDRVG